MAATEARSHGLRCANAVSFLRHGKGRAGEAAFLQRGFYRAENGITATKLGDLRFNAAHELDANPGDVPAPLELRAELQEGASFPGVKRGEWVILEQ